MRFVKYRYDKVFRYRQESFSDYAFQILGFFLDWEVGNKKSFFQDWALDPQQTMITGNMISLKKNQENITIYIEIDDLTDEETIDWMLKADPLDSEDQLILPKKDFIHIIDAWIKIQSSGYKDVWIKNEGNTYWVEGIR